MEKQITPVSPQTDTFILLLRISPFSNLSRLPWSSVYNASKCVFSYNSVVCADSKFDFWAPRKRHRLFSFPILPPHTIS